MGKNIERLNALQVEQAKYVEKRSASGALAGNRLSDGVGLYLFVSPTGARSWRFDYRFPKGGVFDRYVKDRSLYSLQDAAKADRLGLWADATPIAPWEWRAAKRQLEYRAGS